MLAAYRLIFVPKGTAAFCAASVPARLPIAMTAIGIVAMLSQRYGAYWIAGAVAATFSLGNAFAAPQIARRVDRVGQAPAAGPASAVCVLGFVLLAATAQANGPLWLLFVGALLTAAMPSYSALVRARWAETLRGRPELRTAFAFESAVDELVYILGSSLSVGLSALLFPEAGVLAAALLLAAGAVSFLVQSSTEPVVQRTDARSSSVSAIGLPAVRIVVLALVFVGVVASTAEVGTLAVTRELGQPGAASLVIGLYAAGSFLVGLAMGAFNPSMSLPRQFLLSLAVLAATATPLVFAGTSLPAFAIAVLLSGTAFSPVLITAIAIIERTTPKGLLTEGITWVTTGLNVGMALGAFVSGAVIDRYGAANGFWVAVAAGTLVTLLVLFARRRLEQQPNAPAR